MKDEEARHLEIFLSLANSEYTRFTLRDYFAAHALIGILSGRQSPIEIGMEEKSVSEFAYKYADAMLEERKK
ncbi:MAG: hypothetical protein ACHQUC_08400 [Chlamydiales bacterium]